jgi:hypothetical protein
LSSKKLVRFGPCLPYLCVTIHWYSVLEELTSPLKTITTDMNKPIAIPLKTIVLVFIVNVSDLENVQAFFSNCRVNIDSGEFHNTTLVAL